MYRHCIFCSAALGSNEAVEAFPVGTMVAFDAAKGRLWAVCPRCARWNLAPIEERWEAVEAAERLFAGTRLRVQRENIGIARAPDGTRLVRVGAALPGELAAWRYGEEFARRDRATRRVRQASFAAAAAGAGLSLAGLVGVHAGALAIGSLIGSLLSTVPAARTYLGPERRICRIDAPGGGRPLELRRRDFVGARTQVGDDEVLRVELPRVHGRLRLGPLRATRIEATGDAAARLLARAMVVRNAHGAEPATVDAAFGLAAAADSAGALVRTIAGAKSRDWRHSRRLDARDDWLDLGIAMRHLMEPPSDTVASAPVPSAAAPAFAHEALALEMALHEEQERRALQGELTLLESAWREAEEIAAIADRLAVAAATGPATS